MSRLGWALLGGLICIGCVGGGGGELGKPVAQFPTRGELESLTGNQPPATTPSTPGLVDADSWQTEAPIAQAQYPEETSWDKLLVDAARGQGVKLAPELRCAAEEVARFYTVHGGMPDDGLREHLLLRCGSSLASHAFSYLTNAVPDTVPQHKSKKRPENRCWSTLLSV